MKKLTQKQLNEVKSLEQSGDQLLENPTFDGCMDAVDVFIKAQELLMKYASDEDAADQYGELKTECLDYKVWHSTLISKMNAAQRMMADPKMLRR